VKKLILMLLVISAGSVASAATVYVTFTALPATQGNGTTNSQSNSYNGEAAATIAGFAIADLVCDDFTNTTDIPSNPIDYSVETLSSLSGAMFTSGYAPVSGATLTEVQAYQTAAVLLTGLEALTINSANTQAISNYQYALWNLMLPGASHGGMLDSPLTATANSDLISAFSAVQANNSATQADEAALVIFTPTSQFSGNQEFLGLDPPVSTPSSAPEPSTWVLMAGAGLFFCVPRVRSCLRSAAVSSN
jgi:hypothetical protein